MTSNVVQFRVCAPNDAPLLVQDGGGHLYKVEVDGSFTAVRPTPTEPKEPA